MLVFKSKFYLTVFLSFSLSAFADNNCKELFQTDDFNFEKLVKSKAQNSLYDKNRILLYRSINKLEKKFYKEKSDAQISKEDLLFVKSIILNKKTPYTIKSMFKKMSEEKKERVFSIFSQFVLFYYSKHLVFPVQEPFLKKFNLNSLQFKSFLNSGFGYNSYKEFIEDINPIFYFSHLKNREVIISAYIKAIKNNHNQDNKPYHQPELLDILKVLEPQYPDLNVNVIGKLLGLKPSYFKDENLFTGWTDIKTSAKLLNPKIFNNFVDTKIYYEQAELLAKTLKESNKAFIITSATAGVPLNDGFFNNLLSLATKKDIPLVVMAVNRETEHLPYMKLVEKADGSKTYVSFLPDPSQNEKEEIAALMEQNKVIPLHEIPNVYVISYTVNLTNYLTINSIPIMPKNFNPLASLNRLLRVQSGKINIIAHPQLKLEVQQGPVNHISPSVYISTGSISERVYPYRTSIQGRVSELAKNVHTFSAWLFEPPDKDAGLNENSAPGLYHFRPLYERELVDTKSNSAIYRGLADQNYFYGNNGEKLPLEVEYLILGDLHVGSTNPKMFKILAKLLEKNPTANLVLHDAFDGASINHHTAEQVVSSSQKQKSDLDSLESEYKRNVEVINSLLELTAGKLYFVNSNHPMWLKNLLNDKKAYSDSINSKFVTEIRHAVELENLDPFEYLYQKRESYHQNHPNLSVKEQLIEENIYVTDPERIVILKSGEPLYAGTKTKPIMIHGHGHNVSGGKTGVGPSNIPNLGESVVGHTHSPSIHSGVTNVGTFTKEILSYTKDSLLSKWMNGLGIIYKNASKTDLIVVHPLLEKSEPITREPLDPKSHFSDGFPNVILPDNEVLPTAHMTSVHDNYKKKKQ